MVRTLRWMVAALMLLPLAAIARQEPLVDVELPVIEGISAKQVGDAVRKALVLRRWIITEKGGQQVEATQTVRGHMAKIAVFWNPNVVKITYLDSHDLDYEMEDGQRYIHPTYNKWIRNLERDLPHALQREKYVLP